MNYSGTHLKDNIPQNLLQLSIDLSQVLERTLSTDILLRLTQNVPKVFRCHKDILRIRSKWFSEKILQEGTSKIYSLEINENVRILKAVLIYIYTGNLQYLESYQIPFLDLQNAAEKYGLTHLEKIVKDVIKSENILNKTKSIQFMWSVEVDQNSYISAVCYALHDFTLHGNDKWGMEIQPLIQGDETCMSEFYLTREVTNGAHNMTHIINITIYFMNSNSSTLLFSEEISVSEDGKHKIFAFSVNSVQTECLSNTTITLSCKLNVCAKMGDIENFHLKGMHRRHIYNEFLTLSQDMSQMLKEQRHTDITVKRIGSTNAWKLHSYMVFGRTKLPIPLIGKLADLLDFNGETWRSFIFYVYTGQSMYVDEHMRTVYNILKTLSVRGPAIKYERILAIHLNLNNAFGILSDSISNKSNDLMLRAAHYLARNSGFLPDPQAWIKIASGTKEIEIFRSRFN